MRQNYHLVRSFRTNRIFVVVAPVIFLGLIIICCLEQVRPTEAILNCFTPNMFKMAKGGPQSMVPAYGQAGADRATWYPQSQQGYYGQYPAYYTGSHGGGGMKSLFQPKWRSSLFERKKWMNWRMGLNSNFYRPGYGYMMPPGSQLTLPTQGSYSLNDQLNLPPFDSNNINANLYNPAISQQTIPTSNTYGSLQQANDGWSIPYNQGPLRPVQQQQQTTNAYDSYSVSPGNGQSGYNQSAKQQLSPGADLYGTKGGGAPTGSNKQQQNSTKNSSILIADGGYDSYDSHLIGGLTNNNNDPRSNAGYAYPEWYSSSLDSPSKIGHQLYKLQRRRTMVGGI